MAYTLVQSQTTNSTTIAYLGDAANNKISITFVASATYSLTKATIGLLKQGAPTGNITVQIFALDASRYPTGAALGSSETVLDATTITTSLANYDFTFNTPVSLTSGTRYGIVISTSHLGDASNRIIIKGAASAGDMTAKYTSSWAAESDNYTGIFYLYEGGLVTSNTLFFGNNF